MAAPTDTPQLTIVGAGIAGLVAATTAAEVGLRVVVHDAGRAVGGRARSRDGDWKANYGPHAMYGDGPLVPWLRARDVLPDLVRPPMTGFRVRLEGETRRAPLPLIRAALRLTTPAPHDRSFADWAVERAPAAVVDAAAGMASLPCFHAEPERLSAEFVAWRLRRVTRHAAAIRYVKGGWSTLVERLADHATGLGVEIRLGSHVTRLPSPPVIVATSAASAGRLLGREILQHGSRVALLDIGLTQVSHRAPFAVLDLDARTYLARYSTIDPTLSPPTTCLVQGSAPVRDDESHRDATRRLEHTLDGVLPGWQRNIIWRRDSLSTNATGALDAPGQRWEDRSPIQQSGGIFLAGDYVAAPGMLGEVSFTSAIQAAQYAVRAAGDVRR